MLVASIFLSQILLSQHATPSATPTSNKVGGAWYLTRVCVQRSMAVRTNGRQSTSEAMQLLQKPSEEADTFSKPLKRSSCSYEDGCERFRVRERRFQQQYANLYYMRLSRMKGMVEATALNKWGKLLTMHTPRC